MYYRDDREFTDEQHKRNAIPYIYDKLGWTEISVGEELNKYRDTCSAIDYEFTDQKGKKIFVQERFRKSNYSNYNDFTLRYERPNNEDETEQKSEFYKIKSFLHRNNDSFIFVYGFEPPKNRPIQKFAVIDLRALFKHIADKEICILEADIKIPNNCKLEAPIIHNKDSSSNFVCFDVNKLNEVFDDVIIWQIGFNGE
ncbi:MAG: hypothetical protein PUE48_08420 [Eubacterium coprostanoligenes]|uniref:hypothetical protein n=1 Tax=Eubacterium coprostanoligenes TaxID=290054 RepID=UPI00240A969C|nr:hypothetical protein [Eubacterium coprostanoligenes]MDD6666342.1 hypothetical protein [Eubacterium coprostanoligenes]